MRIGAAMLQSTMQGLDSVTLPFHTFGVDRLSVVHSYMIASNGIIINLPNVLPFYLTVCTFENNRRGSNRRAARPPPMPNNAPNDLGEIAYPNTGATSDMCGWKQVKQLDRFDWLRNRGTTRSQNTGPNGDKTTGRGKTIIYYEV